MDRAQNRIEEDKGPFKMLTGKPRANRPSGRPWYRWNDYINTNYKCKYE